MAIWGTNGYQITDQVSLGTAAANWKIVGSGDFDGDGKADILWRDMATGQVGIWSNIMTNGTVGTKAIVNAPGDPSWTIVGTGDFDGDGKADILWQNSISNALSIWFMNGTQIISDPGIGTANAGWFIVGTGDFDGDGKSDILWHGPDNAVGIWLMNGATPTAQAVVGQGVAPGYQIISTGDYNGDGKSDITFQDSNGDAFIWFMSGTQTTSGANIGPVGLNWFMQGPGALGPPPTQPPPPPQPPQIVATPTFTDLSGQTCQQVIALCHPDGVLFPEEDVAGTSPCNYPFAYVFLHAHVTYSFILSIPVGVSNWPWWSGSNDAPDPNDWLNTIINSWAIHLSATLGWNDYFDQNYNFSPGSGALIQPFGIPGQSALNVQNGGPMGTLVYTVNGFTYNYNCTGNGQNRFYIGGSFDDLAGGEGETAFIEATCVRQ